MFRPYITRHCSTWAGSSRRLALVLVVLTLGLMATASTAWAASGVTSHVVSCNYSSGGNKYTTSSATFRAPNPGSGQYAFRWAFFNGGMRIYLSNFVQVGLQANQSVARSFTLKHNGLRVTRVLVLVKNIDSGNQWNSWRDC